MKYLPRLASNDDVQSWREIAAEVESLFGPMPDFERQLTNNIARGGAIAVSRGGVVLGGAMLSLDPRPHQIHWLAVRQSVRRQGVGQALLAAILDKWPTGDIRVVTFGPRTPGGENARRLYTRFGFRREESAAVGNSDEGDRDVFVLRRVDDVAHHSDDAPSS